MKSQVISGAMAQTRVRILVKKRTKGIASTDAEAPRVKTRVRQRLSEPAACPPGESSQASSDTMLQELRHELHALRQESRGLAGNLSSAMTDLRAEMQKNTEALRDELHELVPKVADAEVEETADSQDVANLYSFAIEHSIDAVTQARPATQRLRALSFNAVSVAVLISFQLVFSYGYFDASFLVRPPPEPGPSAHGARSDAPLLDARFTSSASSESSRPSRTKSTCRSSMPIRG
jgi:hypothetical protein